MLGQLLGRQVRASDQQALTLRAIGMSRRQLVAEPLARAAVPMLAGALAAGTISIALSDAFPLGFVDAIEPDPGFRLEPLVHLLGPIVLSGAVLAWVWVALVLGQSARSTGITAPGLAETSASRLRPFAVATGVRFAFDRRAEERRPARFALAGSAVVLAGVVAAATFGASLGRLIDEPDRFGNAEMGIGAGGGPLPEEVIAALDADDSIDALALGGTVLASVGAESVDISTVVPIRGDLDPHLFNGRMPLNENEIALGRVTARDLGVGVDDDVVVDGATGKRTLRVTGTAVVPSIEGGDGIGLGGLVTRDGLMAIDPEGALTMAMFDLRSDAPADTADRIAGEIKMATGPLAPPAAILNLERVRSIPFVVAAALSLLAVLSLGHQLIVSARRRRRDLAVLRALGADRGWIATVVHSQATVFVLIALVLAIPAGYLAGRVIFRAFVDRIGAINDATLTPWLLVVTVLLLLVLANIVGAVTARRIRRTPPTRYLTVE